MNKLDFLRECMSDFSVMPIDEFNKSYCIVCANKDCSRSRANNLSFTNRAENWHKDLFTNPPRAADNDPNFIHIRAKKFISREEPINISLNVFQSTSIFVDTNVKSDIEPITQAAAVIESVAPNDTPAPVLAESPKIQPVPVLKPMNTPFQQGTMLKKELKETKEGDIVLESGGNFTFGEEE